MTLALLTGVVVGIVAMFDSDRHLMKWVLIFWAIALVSFFIHRLTAAMNRCPLCQNPPLAAKACRKHRHAIMIFGSYRMTVALSVLARNHFRCPYCGESSHCSLRRNRAESQDDEFKPRYGSTQGTRVRAYEHENFSDLL